jgi:hypothetical protein
MCIKRMLTYVFHGQVGCQLLQLDASVRMTLFGIEPIASQLTGRLHAKIIHNVMTCHAKADR